MAKEETDFKCLRCEYLYEGLYDPKEPEERACPQCGSNSVRPLKRTSTSRKPQETSRRQTSDKSAADRAATVTR